jgi:hypothetical protein
VEERGSEENGEENAEDEVFACIGTRVLKLTKMAPFWAFLKLIFFFFSSKGHFSNLIFQNDVVFHFTSYLMVMTNRGAKLQLSGSLKGYFITF